MFKSCCYNSCLLNNVEIIPGPRLTVTSTIDSLSDVLAQFVALMFSTVNDTHWTKLRVIRDDGHLKLRF